MHAGERMNSRILRWLCKHFDGPAQRVVEVLSIFEVVVVFVRLTRGSKPFIVFTNVCRLELSFVRCEEFILNFGVPKDYRRIVHQTKV